MSFAPGTASQPTSEIELSFSCRGLLDKDYTSKSDPMCVVFTQHFGETEWREIHRTETIMDCHDPHFASKLNMLYKFEESQPLLFKIFDVDSKSADLRDHQFLGLALCNLAQIVNNGKVEIPLRKKDSEATGSKCGFITISAEELSLCRDEIFVQLRGHNLDKKNGLFGKSDPFLEIFKETENGNDVLVCRTEYIKDTLKPKWNALNLSVRTLCNGDYERSLKLKCYDWSSSGDHKLIGVCSLSVKQLLDTSQPQVFILMSSHGKPAGEIHVDHCQVRQMHTFMDYIRGGSQINCTFSIDFTGSNGNPLKAGTLHFIGDYQKNSYEQVIEAVGRIIEDYDSDKLFPVLGFGAKVPPDGQVSHEFFVNLHPSNPYCQGLQGVLAAYRACIRQVQLHGPTNFSPSINHVAKFAQAYLDGSSYFVLLIITDGIITDMPATCQAIVAASELPMSIIIVGVGNADFSAMEQLDGDTVAVTAGGKRAARDIVQFVPFNQFHQAGADPFISQQLLAKKVLAEIPSQFVTYMKAKGIVPRPPKADAITLALPPDPELFA